MLGLYTVVFLAGVASLSWEVVWQLEASLAIGISARGTALTLATTMGGMALGSALMGRALRGRVVQRPMRIYGALEVAIGLLGALTLLPGLHLVERLDGSNFVANPTLTSVVHLAGIACVLGPPAIAMGATIPVLGLVARAARTNLALLYALNTAGACVGVLIASFALLPYLGIELTSVVTGCVDLLIGAAAFLSSLVARGEGGDEEEREHEQPREHERAAPPWTLWMVLLASGFLSFALEVTWFRALRAAFLATTHGFAIMLAAVLLALAGGARVAVWLDKRNLSLGAALAAAGVAVLLATPVVERFDLLAATTAPLGPWLRTPAWFAATLVVVGPSMLLLGTSMPWVLSRGGDAPRWGRAYAANTLAAVAGSFATAWLLLPAFGFARTAWVLGAAASVCGLILLRTLRGRRIALAATVVALAVAAFAESGVGRSRVMSNISSTMVRVVAFEEGPDSTVAVAENAEGSRVLLIDGFAAAASASAGAHYMIWMGRLPMMLHPAPKQALVICFGTGQTANAVRQEGPESLDIVELNAAVFRMAPLFDANQRVLEDPRVHPIVMDGRAWLRRTDHRYDVITLEPMPPNFAGVNSLYSREFYELAARRLNPGGIVAQWLPIHILSVHDAAAISATFREVFHDSLLWIDPLGATGILVGRQGDPAGFGASWPGIARDIKRDIDGREVPSHIVLGPSGMNEYAKLGEVVTDDNQLLSYGPERYRLFGSPIPLDALNLFVLKKVQSMAPRERAPPPP